MISRKFVALAIATALLAGCGGGGESKPEQPPIEKPPGEDGGGSSPEPLVLGSYPVELEVEESSSIQVEIPFSNPTGLVSFSFLHDLPASITYSMGDASVLLTIQSEEIQLSEATGEMNFTLSDDDEQVDGVFGLVVTNTSGNKLANDVEFIASQLETLLPFDEHHKIFTAHLDLARYSGKLTDSMVSEISANFDKAVTLNADTCPECTPDFLDAPLNEYRAGSLEELELKASLDLIVQNIQTLSDNLMSPINVLLETGGRNVLPHPEYNADEQYGLTSFSGNTQYGAYDEDGFSFSGEFNILEDILFVTETACFAEKGGAE